MYTSCYLYSLRKISYFSKSTLLYTYKISKKNYKLTLIVVLVTIKQLVLVS